MKILLPFLFLFFSFLTNGQTKEDFVDCLNLIFSQSEFEPAFTNDFTPNGAVVITATGDAGYRNSSTPKIERIRRTITQDDFYDFDHPVKIVQGGVGRLKQLGIPSYAPLEMWVKGDAEEITVTMRNQIVNENMMYSWAYRLQKNDDEWEIVGSSVNKQKSNTPTERN